RSFLTNSQRRIRASRIRAAESRLGPNGVARIAAFTKEYQAILYRLVPLQIARAQTSDWREIIFLDRQIAELRLRAREAIINYIKKRIISKSKELVENRQLPQISIMWPQNGMAQSLGTTT